MKIVINDILTPMASIQEKKIGGFENVHKKTSKWNVFNVQIDIIFL